MSFKDFKDKLRYSVTMATAGSYQVIGVLGEGGHGIVFSAFNPNQNDGPLVIKRVHPSTPFDQQPLIESRMRREASPGFSDPRVATAIDSGDDEHGFYLVFPRAPGKDLRAHAHDGWLPTEHEAVKILKDVARGLVAIHAAGRQHRDLKPDNIVYDPESSSAVIVDLGLISDAALGGRGAGGGRLTRPDQPIGTLTFAAPEQITNPCQTDARADLYALGALLYWLFAGEAPSEGATEAEIIQRVTQEVPRRLSDVNRATPTHLSALAEGLLAIRPADRWPQTAREVLDVLEGRSVPRPTTSSARPQNVPPNRTTNPTRNLPCVICEERCLGCGLPSPDPRRCVVCKRTYGRWMLNCFLPDGRFREFRVPLGRYTVGRHEISRSNAKLSRRQAEVLVTPNEFSIRHLDGRNPTLVDGRQASATTMTRVASTVQLADITADLV